MSRRRTRLPQLLSLCALTAVAEGILYYFFLSRPYFRDLFVPFAAGVLVAAGAGTWRMVRPRAGVDRRRRERRIQGRRASQ